MNYYAISNTTGEKYKVTVNKETVKTIAFEIHGWYCNGKSAIVQKVKNDKNAYHCDLMYVSIYLRK